METMEFTNYGPTKSRSWTLLKKIVEKSGKFPPRLVFRVMARGLYPKRGKKNATNFTAPGNWAKITNPKTTK